MNSLAKSLQPMASSETPHTYKSVADEDQSFELSDCELETLRRAAAARRLPLRSSTTEI